VAELLGSSDDLTDEELTALEELVRRRRSSPER
jgi:hypothetical protein